MAVGHTNLLTALAEGGVARGTNAMPVPVALPPAFAITLSRGDAFALTGESEGVTWDNEEAETGAGVGTRRGVDAVVDGDLSVPGGMPFLDTSPPTGDRGAGESVGVVVGIGVVADMGIAASIGDWGACASGATCSSFADLALSAKLSRPET